MKAWLKHKQFVRVATVITTVMLFVFVANPAAAGPVDDIAIGLGNLILILANVIGVILVLLLEIVLIPIISYSNFISHPVVTNGWSIVRDLVNTGFIVLMLVIAFGTMFGIQRMNWSQQIPKLVIAAIVINFSRLITGLFIDFGQVIMIGFANAIQQVGAANFLELLKLRKMSSFSDNVPEIGGAALFGSAVMALVMTIIAVGVVAMIAALLVYRIVILWVLIIMSPAAFLAGAAKDMLSQAGGMYTKWWGKLTAAIMIGPILTFFLWLALATVSTSPTDGITKGFNMNPETTGSGVILTQIGEVDQLTGFIIGIALLLAGVEIATGIAGQLGGGAAAIAGGMGGVLKKVATAPAAIAMGATMAAGKKTIKKTRSVAGSLSQARASRYRGRTQESRADELKERTRKSNADIAAGGGRARRGMKERNKIQEEKAKEAQIQRELSKKYKGVSDGMSLDQLEEGYENNTGKFASEDQRAVAMDYANKMVGNKEFFAKLQRKDPERASKLFKSVKDHKELIGDEKGSEAMQQTLDKNIQLKHRTSGAVSKAYSKMSDREAKNVPAEAYEFAHVREGMVESGVFEATQTKIPTLKAGLSEDKKKEKQEEIKEAKQRRSKARGGMSKDQLKAIDNAYTRNADDKKERARFDTASDALRDADMSDPANKSKSDSNKAVNRLMNARNGGTVEELVKSGGLDLSEVDFTGLDSKVGDKIVETLKEIASKETGVPVIQALQETREANKGPDGDAAAFKRADEMLAKISSQVDSTSDPSVRAVMDGSAQKAFGLDPSGEKFSGATSADSARLEREFAEALAKNPTLILSLKSDIAKGGDKSAITKVAAESTDKGVLRKMFGHFQQSKGSPQEAINRETIRLFGAMLKRHSSSINSGLVKASAETKKGVGESSRHYEKRYKDQLD